MSAAVTWGLSVLDLVWHAIDERRHHSIGVFRAECGHLLPMVTTLREELCGRPCEAWVALQLDRIRLREQT